MDKFLSLPEEKQNLIIDGALKTFGTNGYKKTSMSDIANATGISKAMVFHYFGTKKELYVYLVDLCINSIMTEVIEKFDDSITDLFDRVLYSTRLKISLMQKHPHVPSFTQSLYFENDEEVKEEIKTILDNDEGKIIRQKITYKGVDFSKFKDDVDPNLVLNMIYWLAEGYMSEISDEKEIDLDELYKVFEDCLQLFKKNFYK
ncbi:TetR/AcrR family transcriptional regulator [Oceanobacillus jeddahense]|uniref:TetR/AcrR family transcriptional regulator n=1 Tax=Oceanobacillus jeddahense TaxID=1462527 RepID=UPI003628440A